MSSKRWTLDRKDLQSALRHALLPAVAGAITAGAAVVQQSLAVGRLDFSLADVGRAALVALVAGLLRLVQRWATDLTPIRRDQSR